MMSHNYKQSYSAFLDFLTKTLVQSLGIPREYLERPIERKVPLHMWTNDVDFVIAETPEEAHRICVDQYGGDDNDQTVDDWEKMEPSKMWTLWIDGHPHGETIKCPVSEHIARNGKGYLGSTEY